MARRALEGVLVVALEQAVAAPLATSRLADAGARVIKVERAEGDFARGYDRAAAGGSAYFAWLNRGKESLVLDIKARNDRAFLHRLIARADIFVQNLAPGAVERLGLGWRSLRAAHPRLITCDISSYGAEGPYAERRGYDLLLQAETGLASITGTPDGPGRVGVSACDIAAGLNACQAILEALIARGVTGVGEALQVSLFDSLADWMTVPLLQTEASGRNPDRVGLAHATIAPYGAYVCADGSNVLIAVQNRREWSRLCLDVLSRPELVQDHRFVDNPSRVANREALDRILRPAFRAMSRAALTEAFDAAQIAFGAVNTVMDLAVHPHLRRIDIATPQGEIAIPAPPAVRPEQTRRYGAVPHLGEHTDALRLEFAEP